MAAASIPNLLSMRGRGGGGGRGARGPRGAGPRGDRPDGAESLASTDAIVQDTDTDAAMSRMSAVAAGYLEDVYANHFVSGPLTRRLPIINRGTYMRTTALDMIVKAFLQPTPDGSTDKARQIISLGAGTDTRPFRMLDWPPQTQSFVYHEIDFAPTCRRKLQIARSTTAIASKMQDFDVAENGSWSALPVRGGEYHCHAADIRKLDDIFASDMPPSIRTDLPTLVLSECCLCYLTQEDSDRVLAVFHSKIPQLAIAIYEPMPLDDAFGQVMVSNLKARRIHMPSLARYKDADGQEDRLRTAGFETVGHATIKDSWDRWIDGDEKKRLDRLEGLDEVEEWQLLAAHYVVVWGAKGHGLECFAQGIDEAKARGRGDNDGDNGTERDRTGQDRSQSGQRTVTKGTDAPMTP
ncbi:hypothetical protein RJ55_06320 [Drechmeria coniospora]|nr:hypothetical protein RJ55_06320 [Drechmeria coniospora]